jgi:hypothetical protein
MRIRALGTLAILAGGGCAKPATIPADGPSATQASAPTNRNRDLITHDELSAPSVSGMTVLDAIRSLRPQYLSVRGQNTMPAKENNDPEKGRQLVDQESGKVHASIDGLKVVPLEELASLRAGTVVEVRFLNPAAAMQRFGGAARQGPVILVKTM